MESPPFRKAAALLQSEHTVSWTAHYIDPRLNREVISRAHATKEGALRNACDLAQQKCILKYVLGPESQRIGPVEIHAWCKAHKTAARPNALK